MITKLTTQDNKIVVTVEGTGTIYVRYRTKQTWSIPVTRTGSGTIDLTNLTKGLFYQVAAYYLDEEWDVRSIYLPDEDAVIIDRTKEIDVNIYKLKQEYGYPVIFKKPIETTVNYQTGAMVRTYTTWEVELAIMSTRSALFRKDPTSETSQFDRRIIVAKDDLQDTLTLDTTVMIKNVEYQVIRFEAVYDDKAVLIYLKRTRDEV